MRKRLILFGLTLTAIVAGMIALSAFTAQVVNLTAHVEKDIAVEPVICTEPRNIEVPCFVDPRGGDYGVVLPQELYFKTIEVTLSNSFFEQSKYNDLAFEILWECKQFEDERDVVDNLTGRPNVTNLVGLDGWPDCRDNYLETRTIADTHEICAIDLDGDGKADTVQHCDPEVLDGSLRDLIDISVLLGNNCLENPGAIQSNTPPEKNIEYVATGFLDKSEHKCRYELKLFAPPCEGSYNRFTDPRPLPSGVTPIKCHLADKDRDGNPGLRNPQDFDEFADVGDDFKIQVISHSLAPNKVLIYEGQGNGGLGVLSGKYDQLEAMYNALGFPTDYGNAQGLDPDLSDSMADTTALGLYKLIIIACPNINFTVGEALALENYMKGGGRIALLSDHTGGFCTADDSLLTQLPGVDITVNNDSATPNNDACPPVTDITPDQITAGVTDYDPSATASLSLAGGAISLIRVDGGGYFCIVAGDVTNGATIVAVDQVTGAPPRPGGDIVVLGDENAIDDYGMSDPAGDGNAGSVQLSFNLVDY